MTVNTRSPYSRVTHGRLLEELNRRAQWQVAVVAWADQSAYPSVRFPQAV